MSYREQPSPTELASWVACFWSRDGDGGAPVRVLPDGCIDVVWTEGAGMEVVGPNTTAFLVPLDSGVRVHGARLRAGAAPALLGVSPEELRDVRARAEDVWPDDGWWLSAGHHPADAAHTNLARWLHTRSLGAPAPDPLVAAAVNRLEHTGIDVRGLASGLGVSERSLRRRVGAAVGYGPKRLARVLRLQRALGAARLGEDLARAAFEVGYTDQSHFTNECSALAGASPAVLVHG